MTTAVDEARAWRDQDPDPETRAELDALIAEAEAGSAPALADLDDRFSSRLAFGTAGLRGALGAGPNRMNRVLVAQAAAGLAAYLHSRPGRPSIVIGYDGRTNSHVFATDTAEIMAGAGVRAVLLPRKLPTPVLAFAVRQLDVSAGVMVTASHNPAGDNGYKVYLGDYDGGSQIVPPEDGEIAEHIALTAKVSVLDLPRSTAYETAGEAVLDAYVTQTAALGTPVEPLSVVYTPLHGVGWETARRVFALAGFGEPLTVAEQLLPDPAFPTVPFPNPEEPGVLDLAIERATTAGAELIIANDPDADRLAVAVPTKDGWRRLSGNEVGAMLGWRAAERLCRTDAFASLAASIVSSPALAEVARKYHLHYVDTLTGFKWISRVGRLGFGFEEALGYLVDPQKVRDKDGISAAVDFLSLASELKTQGKSIEDHLHDFAAEFGAFASAQLSIRVADHAEIPRLMSRIRAAPPDRIGTIRVHSIDDFGDGFGQFPPSELLRFWLESRARVIVRPSGTEPKLKVYLDASCAEGTVAERTATAQAVVTELEAGMRALLA